MLMEGGNGYLRRLTKTGFDLVIQGKCGISIVNDSITTLKSIYAV